MTDFSDDFLAILGEWQNGWGDNWDRKQDITKRLEAVLVDVNLPAAAKAVSARCYRKRFLWPKNSRNGGDMEPLFWNGVVEEGVASWSTDLNFLIEGDFKKELRVGAIPAIFWSKPAPDEVVLNISALYADPAFDDARKAYIVAVKPNSDALKTIGDAQSEV